MAINTLLTETGQWQAEEANTNDILTLSGLSEADQQRALRVIASISESPGRQL